MEELGHAGNPQAPVYPLFCPLTPDPSPSPEPFRAGRVNQRRRGAAPCQKTPCPVPSPAPPVLAPSHPPISPASGWAQPAGLGAGRCQPAPGARGHGRPLYFSLLFLVNKALDMPGGCKGPRPGAACGRAAPGSTRQHPQPCPHGTGTHTPPARPSHQRRTPRLLPAEHPASPCLGFGAPWQLHPDQGCSKKPPSPCGCHSRGDGGTRV